MEKGKDSFEFLIRFNFTKNCKIFMNFTVHTVILCRMKIRIESE